MEEVSKLFRQLIEKLPEGLLIVSSDGKVLFLNDAAATLLSIGVTNPIGRHITEVVRVASLQRLVTLMIKSKEAQSGEIIVDIGDSERHVNVYGAPLGEEGNELFISMHDVTQIKKLEKVRTEFIANVSHELKTPITIIRGAVETLLGGASKDPVASEKFLSSIGRQTERLGKLFEDLLELSRVEQDKNSLNIVLERKELKEILEDCIADNRELAEVKDVKLRLECRDDITVFANANLLAQAVQNLVQNALEYTPRGGEVALIGEVRDATAYIIVKDTGCGISQEHLPRIFERFYTVDKSRSRKQGGTGLGLSIVKHIAQVHGGAVHVQSNVGEGSAFRIELKAVGA